LDQDIENNARLVDRAPEPVLLAGDADDDLIEVPSIATTGATPTDAIGKFPAEFQPPAVDRLAGHRDATGRQHLFDHS
jgi:hypothetical protein